MPNQNKNYIFHSYDTNIIKKRLVVKYIAIMKKYNFDILLSRKELSFTKQDIIDIIYGINIRNQTIHYYGNIYKKDVGMIALSLACSEALLRDKK